MTHNYTRTILYAYANIDAVKEQIDDFVESKALSSMRDFSPCVEQCEKILDYTAQKVALIELKEFTEKALEKVADKVSYFAKKEGLGAHARSATIRFEDKK